jgi:transcription elongation factor GreA
MAEIQYFTQEGLNKLKQELKNLKSVEREKIKQALAEARDKGDLSENAEYEAAKEAQAHNETRIIKLNNVIANARIVDESTLDISQVTVLSTVRIMNHKLKKEQTFKLVSESEADFKAGKISIKSPIGSALMGKKKGDKLEVEVPAGKLDLEILEISR